MSEEKSVSELRAECLTRLEVLRHAAIDEANKKEVERASKEAEEKEKAKRLAIRKRDLSLHEFGMKDLIPFYVKDESHHGKDWWLFQVPGYCVLYVHIDKKQPNQNVIRFMDGAERLSNQFYTLGDALAAAKIDKPPTDLVTKFKVPI